MSDTIIFLILCSLTSRALLALGEWLAELAEAYARGRSRL